MRNILLNNNNFQKFSECCEKKSLIKQELDNSEISDEKKRNLKEHLTYLEGEISELRTILQDEIKVL
mgnify:CR=1 FL=1